jgi:hypothetical protein
MLTSDLAINWRRGEKVYPFLVDTDNKGALRDAANLIEIFEAYEERTRAELEAELEAFIGTGTDFKILRGLIKSLMDRCDFEVSAPAEPVELRRKVFLEARRRHPVSLDSESRNEVLENVSAEFETEPETIVSNLYADLPAQQRLTFFETIAPENLLDRYNLAQAQALLYRCVEMKIRVAPSEAANYRAIFGWIKHFGLIHSVAGNAGCVYEITLTGAASLFHRSQKYGIQMAVFLPALLLCGNWRLRAEINDKRGALFYELASEQTDLVSNRLDEPEYENPILARLGKDWEKSKIDWRLEKNTEVVDLGKTAFVPDFALLSPAGEKIYLDIAGFWTPDSLKKRLDELRAAGFARFIIAAWAELRGSREEPVWESPHVVFFKTRPEPPLLKDTAEKLLRN